jgi:hypothetical protein
LGGQCQYSTVPPRLCGSLIQHFFFSRVSPVSPVLEIPAFQQ